MTASILFSWLKYADPMEANYEEGIHQSQTKKGKAAKYKILRLQGVHGLVKKKLLIAINQDSFLKRTKLLLIMLL